MLESVNGTISLDGSVAPDIGLIQSPVKIEVKDGCIISMSGGEEAKRYEMWLKSFGHPQMSAHLACRHWPIPRETDRRHSPGSARVGLPPRGDLGSIGAGMLPPDGVYAPSHSDAVSLNTDIYLDDQPLWIHGNLVDEELKSFESELTALR